MRAVAWSFEDLTALWPDSASTLRDSMSNRPHRRGRDRGPTPMAQRLGPCGCTLGHLQSIGSLEKTLNATTETGGWHLADSETIHAWDGHQWLDGKVADHEAEIHPDDREKFDTLRQLLRASEHR